MRFASCALIALLATACHMGPRYTAPVSSLPEKWIGQRDSTATALTEWWVAFNDPHLNRYVEILLADSFDLRIAHERIQQTKAAAAAQRGAFWPWLDFAPDERHTVPGGFAAAQTAVAVPPPGGATPGINPFDVQLTRRNLLAVLSWEVDLFGRIARQVESADAASEAAEYDLYGMRVALLGQLGEIYFNYRGVQLQRASLERELALVVQKSDFTGNRVAQGLDDATANESLTQQVKQLSSEVVRLKSQGNVLAYQLATLLGRTPGEFLAELEQTSTVTLPQVPHDIAVGLPTELAQRRPDIRRAERQLARATADEGAAIADLFPRLRLSGSAGYQYLKLALLDWDGIAWSYGAEAVTPLFHGGTLVNRIRAQRSVTRQVSLEYGRTVHNALSEAEMALMRFDDSRRRQGDVRAAYDAQERVVGHVRQRKEQGLISNLQWIDAERVALQAERAAIQSETDSLIALVTLYRSLGGGWSEEIRKADGHGI